MTRGIPRVVALLATLAALATSLLIAGAGQLPAAAADTATPGVVSAVPAAYTPKINDGIVYALGQVGSTLVAGGSFTNVSAYNDPTVLSHNAIVAFDATTGAISSTFAPAIAGGTVYSILPGPAANEVYVGGSFSSIDGVSTRLALVNVSTGAIVPGWTSPSINGTVYTMQLVGSRLFVGGEFTSVAGKKRVGLVTLDATSGAVTTYAQLTFTGHHDYGTKCNPTTQSCANGGTGVHSLSINPAATKLVVIGNFINVGTADRDQIAEIDLGTSGATLDPSWKTDTYTAPCLASVYDGDVRGGQFSPDGSYFVVVATGADALTSAAKNVDGTTSPCDGATRFNTADTGTDVQPVWEDLTGNDSLYTVAVTAQAIYVGGHERWLNNSLASDSNGPGSVPRPGLAALDPSSGLPLAWNPGRNPRGAGTQFVYVTSSGLWIGSDTDYIGDFHYNRPKIAFFPYTGGYSPPSDATATVPGRVYRAGPTAVGADPTGLSYRETDGATFGSIQTLSSGMDWSQVDGAFYVAGEVVYGKSDGNLYARSFNGTTFGTEVQLDPYDDPAWVNVQTGSGQTYQGQRSNFAAEIPSLTSVTFASGRLYYTLSGDSKMHWRWFEPDDGIVGADEFTVAGTNNWSSVAGAFRSTGEFFWADRSTGQLMEIGWSGTAPKGTASVVSKSTDWASKSLFFLPNKLAPVPTPTAAFTSSCHGPSCTFTATPWTDPDGGAVHYAWSFGDGAKAAASGSSTASHRYIANGNYSVSLTVTSTGGGHASVSHPVTIAAPLKTIKYVGATHHSAVAKSLTVSLPPHVKKSDQVLMSVSAASAKPGLAVPAGWTLIKHKSSHGITTLLLTRRLTATTAKHKVTLKFARKLSAAVLESAYRNTSSKPIEKTAVTTKRHKASHVAPTLRSVRPGSRVVWIWTQRTRPHSAWKAPHAKSVRTRATSSSRDRIAGLISDSGKRVSGTVKSGSAHSSHASLGEIDWAIALAPGLI